MAGNMDKRSLIPKDNDASELGCVGYDLPFESDRKEKFKMVIGKAKKDMNDPPSKASQQEYGISVDAAAAAAILQAATRGIRNPDLGIISNVAVNGSSVVGRGSNSKSQASSELNEMVQMSDQGGRCNSSLPIAQNAKGVVIGTPGKEESSEAHLSREQKLKAERLKRAKMFVAKLKTGSGPSAAEPSQTLSAEPIESEAALGAGAEVDNLEKVREGSSAPVDSCITDEIKDMGRKHFGDEYSERRLQRKYRLRSDRHEVDDESDNEEDVVERHIKKIHRSEEGKGGKEKDDEEGTKKRSKRKHRPHYSSDEKDERKEKSHKHSRKRNQSRHSHEDEYEDGGPNYHKHSRKKHSSHRSSHEEEDDREDSEVERYHKYSKKKHRSHRDSHKRTKESHRRSKHESSDDDTDHSHKHRKESHRRRSKHESSSDTDHEHTRKHKKESHRRSKDKSEHLGKEDLEEGEISSKLSDQSRGSGTGGGGNRETSLDNGNTLPKASSQPSETTEVPDDLRAKIRAMLMATR